MPVKEKVDPGLNVFEARIAAKINGPGNPAWPRNGSTTVRRVLAAPGGVLYAPYSLDEWRKKIATGQDATTVLIGTKSADGNGRKTEKHRLTQFRFANRILYDTFGGDTWKESSGTGVIPALWDSIPTSANNTRTLALAKASEQFLSNYYDKKSSLRGASSIAEMVSTYQGFLSPAKALRKGVQDLRDTLAQRLYRSGSRAAKDTGKIVGGTWLEWQFGIKPFVQDANAYAAALNKLSQGDFRAVIPLRGTGFDSEQIGISPGLYAVAPPPVGGHNIGAQFGTFRYDTEDTLCIVRGGLRLAPDGGEVPPLMQFGLGFEDILPAVWEGIPWSFFFDYFFNIGSVIDSLGNLQQRLTWCNRTIRNSRTYHFSDAVPLTKSGTGIAKSDSYTAYGGNGSVSYTSTTRAPVYWGDIAPTLRIKLPGFGTKWLNMAALAAMAEPPTKQPDWVGRRYGRRNRNNDLWDWVTHR